MSWPEGAPLRVTLLPHLGLLVHYFLKEIFIMCLLVCSSKFILITHGMWGINMPGS